MIHETQKPRLGFLGLGWIGLQRMAAIAAAGNADIVALADPVEQLVTRAAGLAPKAAQMRALEEMLRRRVQVFFVGSFLCRVLAKCSSCFSVIDSSIFFDAPLRLDFERLPCLAARAAPAAICCFLDLAGIVLQSWYRQQLRHLLL
jgi:hypothetical protein